VGRKYKKRHSAVSEIKNKCTVPGLGHVNSDFRRGQSPRLPLGPTQPMFNGCTGFDKAWGENMITYLVSYSG
jgi:hypothetical protein